MNKQPAETATLGGGCFWSLEAIMDSLEGVSEVVSGYAGGKTNHPTYEQVCSGSTGHAEVVQVHFNPAVISYADLLRVFFAVHNATRRHGQGADVGHQYRSIILYHNEEQEQIARQVIQEIQTHFQTPVVTDVVPLTTFYRAEERHQDYYSRDPAKSYCRTVISPKLQKMRTHLGRFIKKKGASTNP